jgi:hypothetical protein
MDFRREGELGSAVLAFYRLLSDFGRLAAKSGDGMLVVELDDGLGTWFDPALMPAVITLDLVRAWQIAQHGTAGRAGKPGLNGRL